MNIDIPDELAPVLRLLMQDTIKAITETKEELASRMDADAIQYCKNIEDTAFHVMRQLPGEDDES